MSGKKPYIDVGNNVNDWVALTNGDIRQTQILSKNNSALDEAVIEAAKNYQVKYDYPFLGGAFDLIAFNSNTFMRQFMLDFGFILDFFANAIHQYDYYNTAPNGKVEIGESGNMGCTSGCAN